MIKTQNDIIFDTEQAMEKTRQEIVLMKNNIINSVFKECCLEFENLLFEFTVLFYTHRTVWSQEQFWNRYTNLSHSHDFPKQAYEQMIKCVLINAYVRLYFNIEGMLKKYSSFVALKLKPEQKEEGDMLRRYRSLSEHIKRETSGLYDGIKILRLVRNSCHGDNGNYVFKYRDEVIIFNNEEYQFIQNEPVSVSYKFLQDFIPRITLLYKLLYTYQANGAVP